MIKCALFVRLEAKLGKEQAVADLLATGLAMVDQERTTPLWLALRISPTSFGIFDAFDTEEHRQVHLNGPIAQALMARAGELFATPPTIDLLDVLGLKNQPATD